MKIPRTALTRCCLAATAAAVVTACTPSTSSAPQPSDSHTSALAAAAPSSTASQPVTGPSTRPTSAATSDRAAGPTPKASTTSTPPPPTVSATTPAGPADCVNGAVDVSAERGGALPGEELAVLVFTNRSSSACAITGFPGVELFARENVIGKPAIRSGMAVRALTVAPGAHVTAMLHDDTRCNADLSDSVGVYVPNQTDQQRVPLELRACTLTVDPVRR